MPPGVGYGGNRGKRGGPSVGGRGGRGDAPGGGGRGGAVGPGGRGSSYGGGFAGSGVGGMSGNVRGGGGVGAPSGAGDPGGPGRGGDGGVLDSISELLPTDVIQTVAAGTLPARALRGLLGLFGINVDPETGLNSPADDGGPLAGFWAGIGDALGLPVSPPPGMHGPDGRWSGPDRPGPGNGPGPTQEEIDERDKPPDPTDPVQPTNPINPVVLPAGPFTNYGPVIPPGTGLSPTIPGRDRLEATSPIGSGRTGTSLTGTGPIQTGPVDRDPIGGPNTRYKMLDDVMAQIYGFRRY